MRIFFAFSFMIVNVMRPAASRSCHLNFLIVVDYTLELWAKINPYVIKLFCQDIITATGKVTKIGTRSGAIVGLKLSVWFLNFGTGLRRTVEAIGALE